MHGMSWPGGDRCRVMQHLTTNGLTSNAVCGVCMLLGDVIKGSSQVVGPNMPPGTVGCC